MSSIPPCLDFSGIAQQSLVVLQYSSVYSQTDESLNLRQKTSKSVWYGQFLEVPGIIFFKISFLNLDFLKSVSVTMIANSENMKIKKSHLILVSHTDFLKKFLLPTQFFGNFILLFKKRSGRGQKTVFSTKNLCNIF